MAVTQISYDAGAGSVSLPHPARFGSQQESRGGYLILADGSASVDIVAADKTNFTIEWANLSTADLTTVLAFYSAAYGTAVTFVNPTSGSNSVMVEPGTQAEVTWKVSAGATLRYDVRIRLRQQ